MNDSRCAFDLHALCVETLLQLLHQASTFPMEMIYYILSTSKSMQVFPDLLPQLWQQSWSHWEKCKHHHQLLLPQCHSQKILPKLKLVSVFICQDIFVLTCLSCCNNSFRTFVQ